MCIYLGSFKIYATIKFSMDVQIFSKKMTSVYKTDWNQSILKCSLSLNGLPLFLGVKLLPTFGIRVATYIKNSTKGISFSLYTFRCF